MRAPTDVRWPTESEWRIVRSVFGNTMPFRQRVFITNALGGGGAPFTIPTSAISVTTIPAILQSGFSALVTNATGPVGEALSTLANVTGFVGPGGVLSQLGSLINVGYFVNIGPTAYPDMTATAEHRRLLVHEMAHVWQGRNSIFAMSYVLNSAFHQCKGMIGSGSNRSAAYSYVAGGSFGAYNAEQQASIIEHWYVAGMPESGNLWPYIRDYVRRGRA